MSFVHTSHKYLSVDAIQKVEALLTSFPMIAGERNHSIQVQKNDPRCIGAGEHAVVLRIPESLEVAKLVGVESVGEHYLCKGKQAMPSGVPLEFMVESLQEIFQGTDISVPEHYERIFTRQIVNIDGQKDVAEFYYHIAPDLTQDGKFQVHEAQEFDFSELNNGKELGALFTFACHRLMTLPKNAYVTGFDGHKISGAMPDPERDLKIAIERAFFVVVDPLTKRGTLCMGDLDHISIMSLKKVEEYLIWIDLKSAAA